MENTKAFVKNVTSGNSIKIFSGDTNIQLTEKDIIRFRSKFEKQKSCWMWTGNLSKDGYGSFRLRNGSFRAHRISFIIHKKSNIKGKLVLHSCDEPRCVNPSHLSIGTQKDNVHDCIKKGRFTIGSRNGNSKLTEEKVKTLRNAYATGIYTQMELAKKFKVSRVLVSDITRRKTWNHI